MHLSAISIPKYRDLAQDGDDVPLALPGAVFGVFDGATDARGAVIEGVAAGRLAALTVARATAALMGDPANRRLPASDIIAHLSAALRARTAGRDLAIPPSTTLALALDCGADWRFLTLGDSGIRLNGTEVLQRTKIIDDVSTHARLALFDHFRARVRDDASAAELDAVEMATRRAIFLGLDQGVAEAALSADLAARIIAGAIHATGLDAAATSVSGFLQGGICTQHRYANSTGDVLCFDTMNGTTPVLGETIDEVRPKASVHSIELFTDGYSNPPTEVSAMAWEAGHQHVEQVDFHMTGRFATIKGATSTEFFDDRTVVVLTGLAR